MLMWAISVVGAMSAFYHYAVEILRTKVSGLTESQFIRVFHDNISSFMGWK